MGGAATVSFRPASFRAACVDAKGNEINRNRLVALASYIALKNNPGGVIVTDSVTSDGLCEFIEKKLGGVHHRFKRGYKNVIDEAIRLTEEGKTAPLAIETSGHAAFSENYYLDDGAYLITKIIIEAARLFKENSSVDEIIKDLKNEATNYLKNKEKVEEILKTNNILPNKRPEELSPETYVALFNAING